MCLLNICNRLSNNELQKADIHNFTPVKTSYEKVTLQKCKKGSYFLQTKPEKSPSLLLVYVISDWKQIRFVLFQKHLLEATSGGRQNWIWAVICECGHRCAWLSCPALPLISECQETGKVRCVSSREGFSGCARLWACAFSFTHATVSRTCPVHLKWSVFMLFNWKIYGLFVSLVSSSPNLL
jgi:hypothetical protein